ncbi:MAG: hypothetical protein EP317_05810 [Bacillota bacterium]|nr:MAG: hypothetical protein EP317_05810 [Bacillota bacterium]
MKKLMYICLFVLTLLSIAACKKEETFKVTLTIDNMSLIKGSSDEIDYLLDPAGTFGVITFEVTESTPSNAITIVGTTVTAHEVGTASVKATITNTPNADKEFSSETMFTVTVEGIPVVDGEYVLNGGFEYGTNEWEISSLYADDVYGTQVVDNFPHGGEAALNLWYDDNADEESDLLDLTLTQVVTGLVDHHYLFSVWYQGTATSIELKIKNDDIVLESEIFSGYDYTPVPEHDGYVNYGIEIDLTGLSSLTLEIHILGDVGAWGYLDDVSFKQGTLDDLILPPATGEDGYVNFIDQGGFANLTPWTVEITGTAASKEANLANGRLQIWANGLATYEISQMVTLASNTYQLAIYLNGGAIGSEFNADQAYIYVKQGETLHKIDLTPEGWNSGEMKRIELSNLTLSGEVEIGIYINFTSGSNNWINLDNFSLWSYGIPVTNE